MIRKAFMRIDRVVDLFVPTRGLAAVCFLLLGTSGCQRSPTTVSGAVTLDQKPLAIASNARGTVVFQPTSGQGSTASGLLDPAGHFRLATGASSEIAPGKYQVAISIVQLLPKSEGAEQGAKSITPAKYSSPSTSGFEADVLPTANEFNFDMSSSADQSATNAAPAISLDSAQPPNGKDK